MGLRKGVDGVRPFIIPPVVKRIANTALNKLLLAQIAECAGPHQFGAGTPDGVAAAYSAITRELQHRP
eukprot:8224984-Prorocentrum_lima.AAC.1